MKAKQFLLLFLGAAIVLLSTSLSPDNSVNTQISRNQDKRQQLLLTSLSNLAAELSKKKKSSVLAAYTAVRKAYKNWEYLGEYRYPDLVKELVNGAPLPKLEKNSFSAVIQQPKGLQVMDELMAEKMDDSILLKLQKETTVLIDVVSSLKKDNLFYDYEIFEAQRKSLIRIFSLGLTGFDTPGSGMAMQDALEVFNAMNEDFNLYLPAISGIDPALASSIQTQFKQAMGIRSHLNDFEEFDRLTFFKSAIQPLYQLMKKAQDKLGIEYSDEVRNSMAAWNTRSVFIFDDSFLNSSYYSGLPKKFRTRETRELGELLFFDPILSSNNKRACASCHNPEKAFTDGMAKSLSMDFKGTVNRNSPTLLNCIYSERFFHDLRAEALEDQMEHVIADSKEFNTSVHTIIEKLKQSAEYKKLFDTAFSYYEGDKLNPQTISFAISAYVGSLYSFNSTFDRYVRGEKVELHPDAKAGFNLFMGKAACGTCHFAPVFSGLVPPDFKESESEVLGVPVIWPAKKPVPDADEGRGHSKIKEMVPFYVHSFKTPSVRNISRTAPYMHNGSMKTLENVLDFYNKGGGNGIGLHFEYQTLSDQPLKLNKKEIQQIIRFMESLDDFEKFRIKPERLPFFENNEELNKRLIGGEY